MADETMKFSVLDFMTLRSPGAVDAAVLRSAYIHDDLVRVTSRGMSTHVPAEPVLPPGLVDR